MVRWGIRERRTGRVYTCYDFAAAQDAANAESERVQLVLDGGAGWVAVEWLEWAGPGAPLRPVVSRRRAFYEWLGAGHPGRVLRALYVVMGRVLGYDGQPFRRHGGQGGSGNG